MSVLSYGGTIWTLIKIMEKKLDRKWNNQRNACLFLICFFPFTPKYSEKFMLLNLI